jgi:cGMP-dependent protein kinase
VYLVQDEKTDKLFALKSIARQKINEYRIDKHLQVKSVLPAPFSIIIFLLKQEKSVLNLVNFPFIVEFVTSFEDENNLYFLLEYIKGLELFDVIRKIGNDLKERINGAYIFSLQIRDSGNL